MPIILKIGYQKFLVKKDNDAVAALKALAGAVGVSSRHKQIKGSYKEYFWPEAEQRSISLTTVMPDQILRAEPFEADLDEPGTKLIGNG